MTPETRQVPSLIGRQCSTSTLIRVLRPAVGEYPDGMDSACFQYSIPGGTSLRGRVMIHATTVSEWAQVQRELLRLEKEEEKTQVADAIAQLSAQECMERGISLVPLAVMGVTTGLYGRACVSVGDPKGRPLPAHRLGSGDQVRLHSTKGSIGTEGPTEISGVVGKVSELAVEVISEDADEAGALRPPLRLDVVASEATHRKLMSGLDALEKYPGGGPSERIINALFGSEPLSAPKSTANATPLDTLSAATAHLNDSQREAVAFALATRDLALIHGPPGTGKTTTVVALVLEAVSRGLRCLVCAPSNVAVDGILERLVAVPDGSGSSSASSRKGARPRVVRMGHPARLLPQVLEHSLDAIISRHEGTAIVKDIRGEIDALVGQLYGNRDASGGAKAKGRARVGDRKGAKREVKALRKEARTREDKVVREVLKSRDVILATCVGAATYSLRDEEFDLVVIDEAAQALEAACWIPILKGRRLVLAGDHKQLAPTVKSQAAESGLRDDTRGDGGGSTSGDGLGLTLFDRILRDRGPEVCRMLDVQYRMNERICEWASSEMYSGLLRAHPSVATRTLAGLPHASNAEDMAAAVMLLIDTTGCDMNEEEAGGGSRRNEREAEVAVKHVTNLLVAGLLESEVAVISPYNGQVNLLKRLLRPTYPGVEVRSVDGFQGGEKEAIVLSLVRSNAAKKIGFLADARRLNVAVTRAKRHVAVICDAECCGSDAFIGRLLQHFESKGEYRSALELDPIPDVTNATTEASTDPNLVTISGLEAPPLAATRCASNIVLQVEAPADQQAGSKTAKAGSNSGKRPQRGGSRNERSALGQTVADDDVLARVHAFAEMRIAGAASGGDELGDQGLPSGAKELVLPTELTSRQRALVHETAEGLGLQHISRGEGRSRCLILSRVGEVDSEQHRNSEVEDSYTGFQVLSTEVDHDSNGTRVTRSSSREEPSVPTANEAENSYPAETTELEESDSPESKKPGTGVASTTMSVASYAKSGGTSVISASSDNSLLSDLHAERAARRPPPPPVQAKGRRKKGKPAAVISSADHRGFDVELPHAGGSGRGCGKKKPPPKKSGLTGKKASRGGGGGGGGSSGAKASSTRTLTLADEGGGIDDDMAFLDAEIKTQRASEPCYAALLRSTTEAMRANNPSWAKAQDKGKPANSTLTTARRGQLHGALRTKLEADSQKRSKATGEKEKSAR